MNTSLDTEKILLWWYVLNDNQEGPVELSRLKELYEQGLLTTKSLVWREGFDQWVLLESIDQFGVPRREVPPPIPVIQKVGISSAPYRGVWRRFFARTFDVWAETIFLSLVAGFFLGLVSESFLQWINRPGSSVIFGIVIFPFALILDAIVFATFGNTPGKALLGLSVATNAGKKPSLPIYIKRNAGLYFKGFGLGIPFFNLIAMVWQSHLIKSKGSTSYDEKCGTCVLAKRISWFSVSVFVVLCAVVFTVVSVSNRIEPPINSEDPVQSTQIGSIAGSQSSKQFENKPQVTTSNPPLPVASSQNNRLLIWEDMKQYAKWDSRTCEEKHQIYNSYIKNALPEFAAYYGENYVDVAKEFRRVIPDPKLQCGN